MHKFLIYVLAFFLIVSPSALAGGNTPHPSPAPASLKVKPGEKNTNGDIEVVNFEVPASSGTASVSPAKGATDATSSTVRTQSGFAGEINSIEDGDEVELGSNNAATVVGTGGTVTPGGGSVTTVKNIAPAGGLSITVNHPGGSQTIVPPGQTSIVKT